MFCNSKNSFQSNKRKSVHRSNKNSERDNLHISQRDKNQQKKQKLSNDTEKSIPKLVISRVGNTDKFISKLIYAKENKKKYKKNNDFSYKPLKDKISLNSSKIGKVYVSDISKLLEPNFFKYYYDTFMEDTEIRSTENKVHAIKSQNNIVMTPMDEVKKSDILVRNDNSEVGNSEIPALLSNQLKWKWTGHSYKVPGQENKIFYMSICRGNETISIGDCVAFYSSGQPFICKIHCMWETSLKEMYVKGFWFYKPEETTFIGDLPYPGALFQSNHNDDNCVQAIQYKCLVVSLDDFKSIIVKGSDKLCAIHQNNNLFYMAGYFDLVKNKVYLMNNVKIAESK